MFFRFIPTGVGNTHGWLPWRFQYPVHPHGRGEHEPSKAGPCGAYGSSPRAWGTPRPNSTPRPYRRFIPTGVGNTCRVCHRGRYQAVHPHGRGEHTQDRPRLRPTNGSSPRAWGTRWFAAIRSGRCRFIPTGVGNTAEDHARPDQWAVHPHGRGEHSLSASSIWQRSGSSPRAWGTLVPVLDLRAADRFIPTGVWNTASNPQTNGNVPVHPHGRGEHPLRAWCCWCTDGSSPRAWGTRCPYRL